MPNDGVKLSKPWADFLRDVDSALSRKVDLRCIGGFVLMALYELPRPTGDIDYIEVIPRDAYVEIERIGGPESALAKKYHLAFQAVGGIADQPEDYGSRLQELKLNLPKLKLCALEPYDLLLSKLIRNNPKDREDAKYLIKRLNLEFDGFNDRWLREMAPWITNRDRHETSLEIWKGYFSK